ncbi:MAG: DUF4230 domain-containing protein [Bacillota bacterium]
MRKVIGAVALAGGFYIGYTISGPSTTVTPLEPVAPEAIVIDEQAVLSALKAEGQLVGLTGDVSKSITVKDDAWYGDKTYKLAATGTFKLGVNTDDISITTEGNTVKVRFPQPKIISVDIPFDQAVISKDVGFLRKDIDESELQALFGKAREGAVEDIKRDRQAFDKAEESIERTIEGLIAPIEGVEDIFFDEVEAKQ